MTDYQPGDIVIGAFSCTNNQIREQAIVSARFVENGRPAFIGVNPTPPAHMGSGVWGYDDEIEDVMVTDRG
jgi:hypothetical protein